MAPAPSARGASASRPPRIHVVGSSPRSGTTLMFELLTSCFDIEKFGEHEISLFSYPARPGRAFASKRPTDFIHVCRLMRWDPMLHAIYMQRDPRDVVTSRHNKHPDRYWCDFGVWRHNEQLRPRLTGHPRLFECRYEDLATDPDRVQAQLQARFAFLRRLHAFSEFDRVSQSSAAAQRAMNGVRQVSTASIGKWRQNLPRLAEQVERFPDLPQWVEKAGYEPDLSWTALLAGVPPDRSESARRERNALRGSGPVTRAAKQSLRRMGTMLDEVRYVFGLHNRI